MLDNAMCAITAMVDDPRLRGSFPTGTGRAHDTALLCKWLEVELELFRPDEVALRNIWVWQPYNLRTSTCVLTWIVQLRQCWNLTESSKK